MFVFTFNSHADRLKNRTALYTTLRILRNIIYISTIHSLYFLSGKTKSQNRYLNTIDTGLSISTPIQCYSYKCLPVMNIDVNIDYHWTYSIHGKAVHRWTTIHALVQSKQIYKPIYIFSMTFCSRAKKWTDKFVRVL
jgi:hypothetical protein